MRRNECGVRQVLLPRAPDLDQIVTVGAITVQEYDELLRGAGTRREPRTVKFGGHFGGHGFLVSVKVANGVAIAVSAWTRTWIAA